MKKYIVIALTLLITYSTNHAMQQVETKEASADQQIEEDRTDRYLKQARKHYLNGEYLKARLWIKRAHKSKNASLQLRLSTYMGLVQADLGLETYPLIMSLNSISAEPKLGAEVIDYLTRILKESNESELTRVAQYELGKIYYSAPLRIEKNYAKSVELLKPLAEQSNKPDCEDPENDAFFEQRKGEAFRLLGFIYADGGHGITKDSDLAVQYLTNALDYITDDEEQTALQELIEELATSE